MADSSQKPKEADRRTFLKIGAGVVAGAAIATVVEVPYYSSVIGGNSSSSSSSVASLQSQLSSTQEQLSSTAAQLNAAQGQVTSLNNQLSSTQQALTSANSQLSGVSSQLSSTQQALTSANGQVTSLQGQVSSANSQITTLQSAVTSANSQASALQVQVDTVTGFTYLNADEQSLLSAILPVIIPSDSNGPGANEAGVIYFIDRQLGSDYGTSGTMYMQGPYVIQGQPGPITVEGITYPNGSPAHGLEAGDRYQYGFDLRFFWRYGLEALQTYANTAYGGNYETLSASNQSQVLTDLWNNKPSLEQFNYILPLDFAYELFFVTWCGFLTDPLYGGNRNMVGWKYTAFNGVNMGNFYGEGHTTKQLMVATTPTRLQPASLAQYQKGSP
jgi:flagellar biosynthesis chaperone FliJ